MWGQIRLAVPAAALSDRSWPCSERRCGHPPMRCRRALVRLGTSPSQVDTLRGDRLHSRLYAASTLPCFRRERFMVIHQIR